MSCYHPMLAVNLGIKDNGKKDIKIIGDCRSVDKSIDYVIAKKYGPHAKKLLIPCGKCIGCRLEYARQWANRCMLESTKSKNNYFITLTYSDEFLPKNINYDFVNMRKVGESATLRKADLQKFFKDLRNNICSLNYCSTTDFKYFACGEYGEQTMRPHYHICLFNCDYFDDRVLKYIDSKGFRHYTSAKLEKLWFRGLCEICDFSWQTASYTARYVMKKHKGLDSDFYSKMNILPEFTLMSRRPGIGKDYYSKNKSDIYKYDSLLVTEGDKVIQCKPPRYFDRLFDIDNHLCMENIKAIRQYNNDIKNSFTNSDILSFEALDNQERQKEKSIKSLIRKEI